ncbi:hypothetical protein ISF_02767 [Cordyceps fumosorosea ARSEF 2679]|uniref:Uncharacterized protein n=1 Tax=Cordyceps fumosorosea (strain ARSEF 2679) TaxID=1081104 RepID=A0A168B1S6_CORFA|nr:hypothetical protein ISF_02767 [Cordyceps fumosorosea ARSEF 2679]OAA69497.1 hypothetical protein ISF_02767 [Cordyceps fumosorosea ARSEF 2679]
MCEFEISAVYCPCMDVYCKQKITALGETQFTHAGHIGKVVTCFRTGKPLCMGTFRNTDPDRLLVRHGMDPNNANSTQDCKKARFTISEKLPDMHLDVCEPCKERCQWFGNPLPRGSGEESP